MAINNGRYVVTGGYMDPNGNIVEETKYVPATTPTVTSTGVNPTFTNAEVYGLQSQGYANQGDTALANAFGGLANDLGKYSTYANTTLGAYDNLLNYIKGNENRLQGEAGKLYNTLVSDINDQKSYVNRMFGPDGELTQEVNKYYDDLGNYLSTDAGRQAANIAAQGVHSGASLGAIRAQQNEAYNESFARYVQAKEQQINAKQQIASNLINFMSNLRKEYGDTTNQYIIELYKRANDLYNNVAMSAAQDMDSYNKLRFSSTGSGSSSSSNSNGISLGTLPSGLSYDANGNVIDNAGNKYELSNGVYTKVNPAVIKNAQNSLGLTPKGTNNSSNKSSNTDWVSLAKYTNPVYWAGKGAESLSKGIASVINNLKK